MTTSDRPLPHPDPAACARGAPPELTVVIPVHDERDSLGLLWARLRHALLDLGRTFEVLFVDDGSGDGSREILEGIAEREAGVSLIRLGGHQGQTAALAAGFRSAKGEWVATLDADLQNPPEEIARLLDAATGVDLVYGRRRVRRDGLAKRLGSWVGNGVRNAITGHRVADTGCSLKLMRRSALAIIPMTDGMHRFLPTLFAFHGFRIREIDVAHEPRVAGRSKYGYLGRARRGLLDCFAVRRMRDRGPLTDHEETEHEPAPED